MVKPITDKKINTISEEVYDLNDDINLSADDIIDISVDLLHSVIFAAIDENSGVSESDIEKIKADKIAIKKSLTGFIGDPEKTAAYIKFKLYENKSADGGAANGD